MATVDELFVRDGAFSIGGLDLDTILRKHPTPLYLYSADVIEEAYSVIRKHFPDFDILYSFKANPGLAIARKLLSLGAGADVSSMGELAAALKVGFDSENILFVGPGKLDAELKAAIDAGIYAIVAESQYELARIDEIAGALGRGVRVM